MTRSKVPSPKPFDPAQGKSLVPSKDRLARNPDSGFTLLEILIAMTILTLAITAILPLFAMGTACHKRGMDQTMVSMIAPQICAKLQEGLRVTQPGNIKDARIDYRGFTFQYDATFSQLDRDDPAMSAFIVRVTIKWYDVEMRTEQFDTILLRRMPREKSAS